MSDWAALLTFCLALGAVVGVFAYLLGIGGGLLIVPAMLYLLPHYAHVQADVLMPLAIGTSLSTIVITGASSAWAHARLGHMQKGIVPKTAMGLAIGAIFGSWLATQLPVTWLKSFFGIMVLVIAAKMAFLANRQSSNQASATKLFGIGNVVGTISALMGIGGGALLVPALVWYQVRMQTAIATASLGGVVIAIFGTVGYIVGGWHHPDLPQGALGFVFLPVTAGIVLTSMFTTRIGAWLAHRLPTQQLKKIFAMFLVIVGLRMLLG
ncbi:sulfite exporter TauE/SafE family protein [Pseudobowmanella zhangzhouensis]|uniref:sulfite exporter TauE/SafE family protein n=1 Tax=Pseudobowmanella zhangzhouensis TaxID=1537679 RepID=UPI0036105C0B